ncbi:MAG: DNA mismatch repair protein MutS, partial [Alkalispirochaeta sp.]
MSTPMLEQYERIKAQHKDAILLFRLGDFYEMFGEDAQDGARLLGLTLTQRQGMAMCGVPHHASRSYIHRLLRQGRKVAVCEQTSAPDGKSITSRDVVEVLSPGAVFDLDYLDPKTSNFIAAISSDNDHLSLAWCDVSTGELTITASAIPPEDHQERAAVVEGLVRRELARIAPSELLVQESLLEHTAALQRVAAPEHATVVNRIPDWGFNREQSVRRLTALFGVVSLQGFGVDESDPALTPVAALLEYLEDNARHLLNHIAHLQRHSDERLLVLDDATIRNLELVRNMQDGNDSYTLVEVIDECCSSMGSRLLRRWILSPSREPAVITGRHDRVAELYHDQPLLQRVRGDLKAVYDLERLVGRLGVDKAHPKDVRAIAGSLRAAECIGAAIADWYGPAADTGLLDSHSDQQVLLDLYHRIFTTLDDDPAVAITEGGIIRAGFDSDVDRLRALRDESRNVLSEYLEEQRQETGITSLKIKYNRVLGHFFEVPSGQAHRLPEAFIRRQSLANAERFTTTRLGELEDQINNAGENAVLREQELFLELRAAVAEQIPLLTLVARRIAEVDALAGLAQAATLRGWRRPTMTDGPVLAIEGGRHPVVEHHLPAGDFVENDVHLGGSNPRFALVTGPNMAGKSTVLRQTALIVLMAHVGSFVPAESAEIGITDRIFCRVGASDNIARGESTFLVEMNETSNILRNATTHSLIIMDEVGRGTSTHDGLAIAWAVTEYLLERVQGRTLFATHYHELAQLVHPEFTTFGMAVDHSSDAIVFLKKLRPGSEDRSYGIDVARMAGLP